MAYVYLGDDGPDAEDYDSNYFLFDESDLKAVALIEKMLTSTAERDSEFRRQLHNICESSLRRNASRRE
jgi:hypothetical protein